MNRDPFLLGLQNNINLERILQKDQKGGGATQILAHPKIRQGFFSGRGHSVQDGV